MPKSPYEQIRAGLRRELGRRRLRSDVWAILLYYRHVQLVASGTWTIAQLAESYRVADATFSRHGKRRPSSVELPADRRAEALAQIVAIRLDWMLPATRVFRERHLDGKYLTLEEMADWITRQRAAEGPPTIASLPVPVTTYSDFPSGTKQERRAYHLDWLRRETERVLSDPDCELPPSEVIFARRLSFLDPQGQIESLEIRGDGVLAWLKRIAQDIVESEGIGWNEAEAVVFILTENIPYVPLGRIHYKHAIVPAASRLILEVSLRVAPREVAALYGQRRDRILRGRDKPFSDKHLALAVFVEETNLAGKGWVELRDQWNETYRERHPTWCDEPATDPTARRFSLEARTAWRRVTGSTWADRRKRRR
jgi:hypothetical protein